LRAFLRREGKIVRQRTLEIVDARPATDRLHWLALRAPELAREVRAGQFLMIRCASPGVSDPMLRRALFVAAAEPALGQIALLFTADDIGLRWLTRCRPGEQIDILGPFGRPLGVDARTRTLLLVGEGPGLPALMLAAREVLGRGGSATLIAAAPEPALLPPAWLLPGEIEYQSGIGQATELLADQTYRPAIAWADQLISALPIDQAPRLRDSIRAGRIRWDRGFASVLLQQAIPCGTGVCSACALDLRKGPRLACTDGPAFDLREVVAGA
jgi:dihydroorotate dehydrogenase electron transfer subunit